MLELLPLQYTYFEHALRPFEHFVPFWEDNASDILQAIQWLRDHEEEARAMARRANGFVRGGGGQWDQRA